MTALDEDQIDELLDRIPMERWMRLSPVQQARILATHLGSRGTGRSLRSGKNNAHAIPLEPLTDDEIAALRKSQPAYPDGEPAGWWSAEQLRAFVDAADGRLAATTKPAPQLDLERLTPEQLCRVAACQSREQYEQVVDQILAEQGRPQT